MIRKLPLSMLQDPGSINKRFDTIICTESLKVMLYLENQAFFCYIRRSELASYSK
jgi:hypothetical protein